MFKAHFLNFLFGKKNLSKSHIELKFYPIFDQKKELSVQSFEYVDTLTCSKNSNKITFSPPQISKEFSGSNGDSKELKQQHKQQMDFQKNLMEIMKTLPSQSVQDDNVL